MSVFQFKGGGAGVLSSPWFDCLAYPPDLLILTDVGEELAPPSGKARTSGLIGLFLSL